MKTLTLWFSFFCLFISCMYGADAPNYFSSLRFYTYLYAAQCQTSSTAVQSSIEKRLVKHFFPSDSVDAIIPTLPKKSDFGRIGINNDEELDAQITAERILSPLFARIRAEEHSCNSFIACWPGSIPEHVMQIAKWTAWFTPLPYPPPPIPPEDHTRWNNQFCRLEEIRNRLTDKEQAKITAYHGRTWLDVVHSYLKALSNERKYHILSILTKALYDGIICEMQAKYRYCVPRPYMQKPSFKPLITPLDTPSYPSGHAIQAAILATVLSHFLPEKSNELKAFAQEAQLIRLQEGVHFPEDVEQGALLGYQIASLALTASSVSH